MRTSIEAAPVTQRPTMATIQRNDDSLCDAIAGQTKPSCALESRYCESEKREIDLEDTSDDSSDSREADEDTSAQAQSIPDGESGSGMAYLLIDEF